MRKQHVLALIEASKAKEAAKLHSALHPTTTTMQMSLRELHDDTDSCVG
ncbi:hypothetical protein MAXJ12_11707 [Mesorhizobium alhagi CCNWXJ12-2]|uniref:Uncharacterized protein n=1 Tax=Mesorhizobium alhagi CCNWXJ12-2 TaxID=1107882 RepID=H0HQB1_9HYPH|nr:hypothetical protein MAXJ12_11707 [Mesorhizobium alhagi CCNWXJ12-2]